MDDDNIDTSGIPDFAPNAQWAKGPPQLIRDISELQDMFVPVISRETIIGQLWVEAMDRRGKNPIARIRALELIAQLKGYTESTEDTIDENTDNLTVEEIKSLKDEFEKSY